MAKVRGVVFTINNWTAEDYQHVDALAAEAVYSIVGEEVGEKGTPHLQGYLYFSNARSFKALSKAMPRAHFEAAKGSAVQNQAYCSKGGKFKETGTIPSQGKRSDIDGIRELLEETPKMSAVVDAARSFQSIKVAQEWLKYKEKPRAWETEVSWYYGPTGSGKSRAADELAPEAYRSMGSNRWWEGYDGHEDVIIDDMRRDFCKFHELLRLTDRYGYRVEAKGGSRQFLARRIIITSCYSPEEMFVTREDIGQLMRRIKIIRHYQEDGSYIVEKDARSEASGSAEGGTR